MIKFRLKIYQIFFFFFDLLGVHRSVTLLTKPKKKIERIDFNFVKYKDYNDAFFNYSITTSPLDKEYVKLTFLDQDNNAVIDTTLPEDERVIEDPKLWFPYTMIDNKKPHLYRINVKILSSSDNTLIDEVEVRTGIRFIEFIEQKLYINSKLVYLTGFGKHEDMDIKGRGFDLAMLIKDFNLIKWLQANSFRTSHYPYSEELMDLADEYGVLIIDECPAVSLNAFPQSTLEVHKQQLESLINRDKHHPSVLAWSVANEAETNEDESDFYFKEITEFTHSLDPNRPITAAINKNFDNCHLSKYLDFIMINRYVSWYSHSGSLELVRNQVNLEVDLFFQKFSKPIMFSEYGAESVSGLHQGPSRLFSEDYQVEFLRNHFDAFDDLREKGYFIGEHYWNFADFMTKADYTRVNGKFKISL